MKLLFTIAVCLLMAVTLFGQNIDEAVYSPNASFVVTSSGDSNDLSAFDNLCLDAGGTCTLRAAIQQANALAGSDTITFSLSTPATVNLLFGELYISQDVTITGPGARNLTVRRDPSIAIGRIFNIQGPDGSIVHISGMTIANGYRSGASVTDFGGGIYINRANTVNLSTVTLRDNAAEVGGGVFNYGTLNIFNSTIHDNFANSEGGAIENQSIGTVNIANTTISNNRATNFGGAITAFNQITLNNVTMVNNRANIYGGAIYNENVAVTLRNTIIANNTASSGPNVYGLGYASRGSNLIANAANSVGFTNGVNGDKVGSATVPINPLLGVLANKGGQTDTHELLAGSPAIDAGDGCVISGCASNNPSVLLTNDQRGGGFSRRTDGNGDGAATIDIGAFELPAAPVSCIYTLGSSSQSFSNSGGTGSVTVTTSSTCSWSAQSNNSWISVTTGNGTDSATVQFNVQSNSGAARVGTITIAEQTFTVNQAAAAQSAFNISGTISYGTTPAGQPARFVSGVNLSALGSVTGNASTDSLGAYLLSGLSAGAYTVTPTKAAQTTNTGISLQDASEAAKIAFNQNPNVTANQRLAADATGNGSVSLQDASEIAKRAFNITSANSAGQWKFVSAPKTYPSISSNLTGENYEAILVGDVTGNWTPPPPPVNRPAVEITEEQTGRAEEG
ncbi:MAG TPA: choice-of-anchor Q domain-containing protein, partial [Pyrinomonadaceae bacterium]